MTATLSQNPLFHVEIDGKPLVGGKVYTYQSGTATPLATYQDEAQTILNTNPVILDSNGDAVIRLLEDQSYRIVVKDSLDSLIETTDDVRANVTSAVASGYLKKTGAAQSVSSVVTFTSSPKAPTPTADDDVANKAYVLGAVAQGIAGNSRNLKIDYPGTGHAFTVTADALTVKNAAEAYRTLRNVSLTINASSVGANGLDTGALAISTWYYVYVIWNETTVAGLVSLSSSAPTLPTGYTYSARIGSFKTDATTANKYPLSGMQRGDRFTYKVVSGSNVAARILIGTTAGSVSVPTYASTAISDYSPATAKTILIGVSVSGGSIIMANSSGYGTAGSTTNPAPFYSTGGNTMWPIDLIDQNIYYANDSANTRIWANGWIDV